MEKLKKAKNAVGFAAGLALGAGGMATQIDTEAEIAQRVDDQAASKVVMMDAAHRPTGACLACHQDN